jgi:hypothetical protein
MRVKAEKKILPNSEESNNSNLKKNQNENHPPLLFNENNDPIDIGDIIADISGNSDSTEQY